VSATNKPDVSIMVPLVFANFPLVAGATDKCWDTQLVVHVVSGYTLTNVVDGFASVGVRRDIRQFGHVNAKRLSCELLGGRAGDGLGEKDFGKLASGESVSIAVAKPSWQ
jgi:hypothetical protein